MTEAQHSGNATAKALRATVRSALSGAVWAFVGLQMLLVLLTSWSGTRQDGLSPIYTLVLALIIFLVLFLTGGIFSALARDRSVVGLSDAVHEGRIVFPQFLLIMVKAMLLAFVFIVALSYIALAVLGMSVTKEDTQMLTHISLILGTIANIVFLYWLPFVFVARRFELIPSLRAAVAELANSPRQALFPACLIAAPLLVTLALPESTSVVVLVLVTGAIHFLKWIAYVYCVELLGDRQVRIGVE